MVSSSVKDGYMGSLNIVEDGDDVRLSSFEKPFTIDNLHGDSYHGSTPLQGPFTEALLSGVSWLAKRTNLKKSGISYRRRLVK